MGFLSLLNFYSFLLSFLLSRRTIFPPDPGGSEPAAGRFYPAWHRFHFISDEDVGSSFFLFCQKRHKSGQLALAPRRSSRSNFARVSFAHSSTQVRNVTAHSVDGCETRRTQSPFDEIYMAPRCFWIAVRRFPAPARGARPGPCSQPAASSRQT